MSGSARVVRALVLRERVRDALPHQHHHRLVARLVAEVDVVDAVRLSWPCAALLRHVSMVSSTSPEPPSTGTVMTTLQCLSHELPERGARHRHHLRLAAGS
jgi:hypothetical protein